MNDSYTSHRAVKSSKINLNSSGFRHRPMIRISIYHWLPIADNMLSEIERRLRALPSTRVSEIQVERDAVSYLTVFEFRRDFRFLAAFPMHVKINQRGFCQHVINIAPVPGTPLHALLNEVVPELKREIANLLYVLVPDAVRSKLATLEGGITPFQQFQSITLDPPLDQAARAFLFSSQVTAIILDHTQADILHAGFIMPELRLHVPSRQVTAAAYTNEEGDCFLFYSDDYHPDEWTTHDSVIYKYCALVLYVRFLEHTISILKRTRDHIIPLRRRLALGLQGNFTEHFEALTQIKRYLTYINIKLPLVHKVLRNLQATRATETFAAKIATFHDLANVFNYPAIRSIEETFWQPHVLIEKIQHESDRAENMFDEELDEIRIVSTELSQVLEGSLLSEQLQVSARALDATQATLEIERSAKNLANTNKWMTVLLLSALGTLLALAFGLGLPSAVGVGVTLCAIGFCVTAFALWRHRAYFRLVIPIRANLKPNALTQWMTQHRVSRNKTNGNQITCTWREAMPVHVYQNDGESKHHILHTFDVTIDLQRRGFLNAITLEAEHHTALFDPRDLVEAVFGSLRANECLNESEESSLYANALSQLEIPLEPHLPALNKLLTLPTTQVTQIVRTGATNQEDSLSKQDLYVMQDLNAQPRAYKDWLLEVLNNSARANLLALLGLQNVRHKLTLLERLEEQYVNRT